MSIILDGVRSQNLLGFAKNKLNTLIDMFGAVNTRLVINGYKIKLFAMDDIRKVEITAPPATVVVHAEYPVDGYLGSLKLYYAEPYGASAYQAGALGDAVEGEYVAVRTSSLVGADYYTDAPGIAAIFPSMGDLHHSGAGFYRLFGSDLYGTGLLDTKFANAAATELGELERTRGASVLNGPVGGWLTTVNQHVFACYFRADSTNSNTMRVIAHGFNYRDDVLLDLDSPEIQSAIGTDRHLNIKSAFAYPSPTAGAARVAVFASPVDPVVNPELLGVYFFDFTLVPPDAGVPAALTWAYSGRCQTAGLGGEWATLSALPKTGGPVVAFGAQDYKSCVFSAGDGGVLSIIRDPSDAALDGLYSFSPAGVSRLSASTFPALAAQEWPTIFRGEAANLCVVEKLWDTGPDTIPLGEITAIYTGGPTDWAALPMPEGALLAARPVCHNVDRTVFVGVVFDGADSYFAQYDSAATTAWSVLGKVAAGRMLRPVVGLFGNHEYSVLAQRFSGSFPVTSWAGTQSYIGA